MVGDELQTVPFSAKDGHVVGPAEARSAFGDGVQHRLEISRGTGDHPQDLAGRGFSLEGLGQGAL